MAEKGLKDCGEKLRRDSDAWGRDYTICEVTELMGESPGTVYGLMRAGIIVFLVWRQKILSRKACRREDCDLGLRSQR